MIGARLRELPTFGGKMHLKETYGRLGRMGMLDARPQLMGIGESLQAYKKKAWVTFILRENVFGFSLLSKVSLMYK